MASIQTRQKNGRPSYTVKVRLKGYPSVFATFERLTDARRWASKTETEMREGRYFQKSKTTDHTFSQVLERFYQDIVPNKQIYLNNINNNSNGGTVKLEIFQ